MSLLRADARHLPLAEASVQCVVTSPPYWGLRDYGVAGQLGLEASPFAYVEAMVAVFRQVHRVLRDDGVAFLNLGDCYATGAGAVGNCPGGGEQGARWRGDVERHRDEKRRDSGRPFVNGRGEPQAVPTKNTVGPMTQPNRMPIKGLKPKDLCMIPARVALALQADGWWLRSDIVWSKPNPMPESVTDRPTKAHEYVFLLAKSERYHYDAAAVAEPISEASIGRYQRAVDNQEAFDPKRHKHGDSTMHNAPMEVLTRAAAGVVARGTRNLRSVWTIPTKPFAGAHFATMPEKLVERCVLAGSRPGDRVLDPFLGSGTVARVAISLGRRAVGCDLNSAYLDLARERTTVTRGLPLEVA